MSTALDAPEQPAAPAAFRSISTARKVKNQVATVLVTLAFLVAVVPLVWLLVSVVAKGLPAIVSADWWTHSLSGVTPDEARGGVYHAIVGTVVQALIAGVIAVPVGILAAVYLVEYGRGRLAKVTSFMVDILSGVPSIVAALFIVAVHLRARTLPERVPRGPLAGAAHAPGGGPQHRGDAAAGARRAARGGLCARDPEVAHDRAAVAYTHLTLPTNREV